MSRKILKLDFPGKEENPFFILKLLFSYYIVIYLIYPQWGDTLRSDNYG